MKIAFFGTPQFAVMTLRKLLDSRHKVVCAFCQPDKPAGRGRKLTAPPVKVLAENAKIPVHQPKSVKSAEAHETLAQYGVDAAVVVAYGQILPEALLGVPRFGFLNVHASLLPKYRGAAPIQWAIVNGERETGVTIMQIDKGLDSGPIVAMEKVDILDDDDARSVGDLLSLLGGDLMVRTLDDIEAAQRVEAVPQNHDEATYAPLIKRDDARIDWNDAPEKIICLVRGFVVWPQAYTATDDIEVKITGAGAVDPSWMSVNWKDERVPVGTLTEVLKDRGVVVKTGEEGLVLVTRIKMQGKREMDANAAVNGNLLKLGMRFR